ncbi:transglycosylase SLT domain-containing protein [Streptomyces sp. NBC_00237]|uniref:transglycosylase SLT domain-containing protein n=1 Tax=Streptomyces sp. NBC_00237 TaxID=2975687 RepID=UPI002255B029|nr:transglycosylase SLT domain-containing protein [Streptomyces sp. NBC_00237]MCX5202495.1 transglycosylase SLT domain-containing protein [Streptomyces sp. NBC_00237]
MAIQVGSVEVDVVPNTRGIYAQLRSALVPAATRAGDDAGSAAGRSFGPAMQAQVGDVGLRIGQQIGSQIAARITAEIRNAMRNGITQGGAAARPSAVRQGDDTGGAFSRALKTRLEAAFRSLPKINIDANTSEADADLQALRVRMETLANKRIGIDIDAALAKTEIKEIEAELTRLGASHPNVQVRADTAAARAELAAVRAQIDAVDGKRARIDVDTSGALSAVMQLAIAIGGLAAIPAVPILAAGIGAVGSAAVAAGVGVGALAAVAAPAFMSIGGALQAQKAAQDAATNATARGGQAAGQGASKALQLAGAQQSLATAHRNAARQIKQAEQGVGDAVRSAAEADAQAAQQVKAARQGLADAVQQAADRQRDAAERVAQAEQSLADAQRTARQAQQDLTRARKDATAELAEMGDRLTNARLSERDAALSVQEAEVRLRATQVTGSKATAIERQRAQLAYDQAVQRLKEQQAETKNLTSEKAAADKAGVEGSETVKAAQERVASAERGVAEQQKALGKARTEAARQQVQSQRDIAAAQEKVAESQRNVTRVQEDGARSVARAQDSLAAAQASAADSIASAQRQIASAQQSAASTAAGGIDQAAVAQAKYQAALAKLTPTARATFDAFIALRTAFKSWSESLQPAVMPLFTRALVGLKNSLPGLTPFVLAAAKGIGILQDKVSAGFKSPWWKSFKKDLAGAVVPAIVGLGSAVGNVFKTIGGIVDAFLPHMDSISERMQAITGRWAKWATGLKGSPEFERFLAYAARMGPVLAKAIGDISSAFYQMAKATAPLSGPVLTALGAVARAIASIASNLPWLIQLIYAVWVATKLWTLAVIAFNLAMNANPIVRIITLIVALVAAVVYAYKNWESFRNVVDTVWSAISAAAMWAWNTVLKPIFAAFAAAFRAVATVATWLWENIIGPVFTFIANAAKVLFTVVFTVLITPLKTAFEVIGAVVSWLWTNIFSPVFTWIAEKARWLWQQHLKPVWDQVKVGLAQLGAKLKELWDRYGRPVMDWLAEKFTWLWQQKIKPSLDAIKPGLKALGDRLMQLWRDYAKPALEFIGDKAGWLWRNALKPAFIVIGGGLRGLAKSFDDTRRNIDTAWSKLREIARAPVRFIIDQVYNRGLVPTWNAIATAFGAPKIPRMEIKGWATGGVLPGYTPGRDVHLAALSGGEAVMRPEWTRAVGPEYVNAMNAAARGGGVTGVQRALGLPGFKDGGIFDWIGSAASAVKGVGSKAWEGVKSAAGWLTDTLESSARAGLKAVVNPLMALFPSGGGEFGRMIHKIPSTMIDAILGYTKKADDKGASFGAGSGGPIGGTIPTGQRRAIITQALAAAGVPPPGTMGQWLAGMNTLITRESGWNPRARNNWDINAKNGVPSQGLAQTIPPTWSAYVPASLRSRGILDPVSNVAAAVRYIVSRYGNITNVQQANANRPPAGYDSGGYLQPGLNLAYNGTGKPEPVFTSQQANALIGMAASGGSGIGDLNVKVYVGDREITDIARAEVHASNGQLIQVLNARGGS